MKHNRMKTILVDIVLFIFPFLIIAFLISKNNGFGSNIDWYTQHISIADYFRRFFYETGKLFPEYIADLGAGQSAYHFAYYGLFRYDVLLSFCFPFLKMSLLLPIIHIASIATSSILMRHFLKRHVSNKAAIFGALCLTLSAPLLYHAAKQVMFVIYMPFVILGMMGCDRLLSKQKIDLYVLALTGAILTSFYYTIGTALACFLYLFLQASKQKTPWLSLVKQCIFAHILAVLLSAFFWMPSAYALFHAGAKQTMQLQFFSLLKPDLSMQTILYSPYSIGLGMLMLFTTIAWCFQKTKERYFAFILLLICLFPICLYVMNIFLYARAKALIPLIPFVIFLCVKWLDQKNKLTKPAMITIILFTTMILLTQNYPSMILIDICLAFFILLLQHRFRFPIYYCYLPILLFNVLLVNLQEERITFPTIHQIETKQNMFASLQLDHNSFTRIADYHENAQSMNLTIPGIHKYSIYTSIHNGSYNSFFYDVMQNNMPLRNRVATLENGNPFFLSFMNVRYLITTNSPPNSYQKMTQNKNWTLYQSEQTLPFAYGTSQVMSQKQFQKLSFPYTLEALLKTPIVPNTSFIDHKSMMEESKESFQLLSITHEGKWLQKTNDGYAISANTNEQLSITPNKPLNNEYLILTMKITPKTKKYPDFTITINKKRNRLSGSDAPYPNHHDEFTFILDPSEVLKIDISKGDFKISDIQTYRIPVSFFDTIQDDKTPFTNIQYDQKEATFQGEINLPKAGWIITSLPMQDGFKVLIDGKYTPAATVNTAFLGFQIPAGKHHVTITFEPPLQTFGKYISLLTLVYIACHKLLERRKRYVSTTS